MHKLFACYERGSTGWMLVVYHDNKPGKPVGAQAPDRTAFFDVPAGMMSLDGTPIMGLIQKAFPAPKPDTYSDEPIQLGTKEEDYLLPDWADRRATPGVLLPMQQLFTKDGTRMGNATIVGLYDHRDGIDIYTVVTDANNWMKLSATEIWELFTEGEYILKDYPNPKTLEDIKIALEIG